MAQRLGVEQFAVGSELSSISDDRPGWLQVIREVRESRDTVLWIFKTCTKGQGKMCERIFEKVFDLLRNSFCSCAGDPGCAQCFNIETIEYGED